MKKISAVLFLIAVVLISVSCERECVCTGYHPTTDAANEVHSFGKMTKEACLDKQYRMNKDTTFTTNKTWVCKN